jgi:hypothetical protein
MAGSSVRVVGDVVIAMAAYSPYVLSAMLCRKSAQHSTDNISNDTHIGTRYVIFAKHWLWLPDDGFM